MMLERIAVGLSEWFSTGRLLDRKYVKKIKRAKFVDTGGWICVTNGTCFPVGCVNVS